MRKIYSSLTVFALVVGCGRKPANSSVKDINSLPGAATGQGLKKVTKNSSELVGAWNSPCSKVKDNWYRLYTTTYTSTKSTIYSQYFSKEGCAAADLVLADSFVGTYTTDGNKIDYNFKKYFVTPYTDEQVETYKSDCGSLTWLKGLETEASKCEVFKDFASMFYDIFKVEGSKLFSGEQTKGHGGSTVDRRPIEFSETYSVRQ